MLLQTEDEDREPLEMHILKKLAKNIEGVVALLDIFLLPGGWVLVMESVPPTAKNIFNYALSKIGRLDEKDIIYIVRQIIDMLTSIHKAGVFIQDLTHENLLIETDTRKVHLVDFGWAAMASTGPFKTFYGKHL